VGEGLLADIIYGQLADAAPREMFFFYCAIEMSCSPSEEAAEKEWRR